MAKYTKKFPQSSIGYQRAMTKAKEKKDGVEHPDDNILTATTSTRLDTDYAAFEAAKNAIDAKSGIYHNAVADARPQRILLRESIVSFYERMNTLIKKGKISAADRAYYGLSITNRQMPLMNTDDLLLAAAAKVLSGDILRRAAGGIAMDDPTIAEFTIVYNIAKPFITAISNALTALNNAKADLEKQTPEIKDLIKHVWDDVVGHYSLSTPAARRQQARLWGVRYQSVGIASTITGVCKDSVTGALLFNVQLHLVGVGRKVLSDAEGRFVINTSLFEDLTILAKLIGYEDFTLDFFKEDGVTIAVSIVMVKKIV